MSVEVDWPATRARKVDYDRECARLLAEYERTRDPAIVRHVEGLALMNRYVYRTVPDPLRPSVERSSWVRRAWRRIAG